MSTGTLLICMHCGRPITGQIVYGNGVAYHMECTQPPALWDTRTYRAPTLTEEDIRRIVREEIARSKA